MAVIFTTRETRPARLIGVQSSCACAMTCYLSISNVESECEGCGRLVPPGPAGWTDELLPGRWRPLCPACLDGLDPELAHRLQQAAGEESGRL